MLRLKTLTISAVSSLGARRLILIHELGDGE
jgi:hypothetical protein